MAISESLVKDPNCEINILEFDHYENPEITDVVSFSCSNGNYDVLVSAIGTAPLLYRIVEKNGSPFLVQNANQATFLELGSGTYKFQVEDACGNIINKEFQVPKPISFELTASTFCQNQSAFLSVPNIPGLVYKWWKNNDTNNPLSTTNILVFNNFNDVTDAGTYTVNVTHSNPNSCINLTFQYQILPNSNTPNAGEDTIKKYCTNLGSINLSDLLQGPFNAGGIWEELINSNALLGNNWNSTLVGLGTYKFKYTVNGNCTASDESILTIQLFETPEQPTITPLPTFCRGENMPLEATTIPNVNYQWTGPNNFNSTLQNPIITDASNLNSEIYTLTVSNGNCSSEPVSVQVLVAEIPNFEISYQCVNDTPTLTVIRISNSFQTDAVTYNWTNATGNIGTTNPIALQTQVGGQFSVTVTNEANCAVTKSSTFTNIRCSIQKGISANEDGNNDYFDLSNLEVEKLTIFNRYGVAVYTLENYQNQWKGQDHKDRLLPAATYYYVTKLRDGTAETGWIYLTRDYFSKKCYKKLKKNKKSKNRNPKT